MRPIALFGGTAILVSAFGLLFLNETSPWWLIMILFILMGIGVPGFMTQSITWGMDRLDDAWTADGTAIINCLRTIGNALGTAVFVAIMSGTSQSGAELTAADARVSFIGMFGLAVALFLVSVFLVKNHKKKETTDVQV
jgi:MFS family permease